MAPSRGLALLRARLGLSARSSASCIGVGGVRNFASFTDTLSDPKNKLQSYISTSNDPYLNLAIEDHILRKSPPHSTVLFMYVNRACVVIGRNQNPWTEVNLGILHAARNGNAQDMETEPPGIGAIDLVRRRSGGGTVFHDEGNLNWSVTCPRSDFTRDRHAEMVVRALRKLNVDRARVNERHDIVLDQGHEKLPSDPEDTHRTPYTVPDGALPKPLKVSGSAYKLTRLRALHHATTLLSSPNLHIIPRYLRSPAKRHIQAKGVESVSSPVGNIGLDVKPFQQRLQEEFANMYAAVGDADVVATVGTDHLKVPDIKKGYDELRTEDWMWSQTPQFDLLLDTPDDIGISMNVHHGIIKSLELKHSRLSPRTQDQLRKALVERKLQDIREWSTFLQTQLGKLEDRTSGIASRLDELMPVPRLADS
ncbi:lipoate-protein ligase A [Parastagonospora nodorum]|nr:lipoate-protein ligase A [Parastagonospora nodorum]